ncbi:proton-translocating NADH-quinone oxidoreductase, chain N, partial [mine drainage metagenome]
TLGFVGKFYVFGAAVEAGGWFIFLAVAGLLNSALSVFYYGRVLRIMYMSDAPGEGPEPTREAPPTLGISSTRGVANAPPPRGGVLRAEIRTIGVARWGVILGCAVLTIAFGIYPTPLIHAFNAAAEQFLRLGY